MSSVPPTRRASTTAIAATRTLIKESDGSRGSGRASISTFTSEVRRKRFAATANSVNAAEITAMTTTMPELPVLPAIPQQSSLRAQAVHSSLDNLENASKMATRAARQTDTSARQMAHAAEKMASAKQVLHDSLFAADLAQSGPKKGSTATLPLLMPPTSPPAPLSNDPLDVAWGEEGDDANESSGEAVTSISARPKSTSKRYLLEDMHAVSGGTTHAVSISPNPFSEGGAPIVRYTTSRAPLDAYHPQESQSSRRAQDLQDASHAVNVSVARARQTLSLPDDASQNEDKSLSESSTSSSSSSVTSVSDSTQSLIVSGDLMADDTWLMAHELLAVSSPVAMANAGSTSDSEDDDRGDDDVDASRLDAIQDEIERLMDTAVGKHPELTRPYQQASRSPTPFQTNITAVDAIATTLSLVDNASHEELLTHLLHLTDAITDDAKDRERHIQEERVAFLDTTIHMVGHVMASYQLKHDRKEMDAERRHRRDVRRPMNAADEQRTILARQATGEQNERIHKTIREEGKKSRRLARRHATQLRELVRSPHTRDTSVSAALLDATQLVADGTGKIHRDMERYRVTCEDQHRAYTMQSENDMRRFDLLNRQYKRIEDATKDEQKALHSQITMLHTENKGLSKKIAYLFNMVNERQAPSNEIYTSSYAPPKAHYYDSNDSVGFLTHFTD